MDELNKEGRPEMEVETPSTTPESTNVTTPVEKQEMVVENTDNEMKSDDKDKFAGKFTIQLSSHRSRKEAEEFAGGFTVRGYDPIINEVRISGRGTWYRVSLGVFESASEAKNYIIGEKELFLGQDYVIGRFD